MRKVLYERVRLRKIRTHLSSIDVLMNLDENGRIGPDDSRVVAGGGPNWYYPDTGEIVVAVREAASRCQEVADLFREIRRDLAKVKFDATDKRYLMAALEAQAKSMDARARIWSARRRPNVTTDVTQITGPQAEAVRNYLRVNEYLHEP